MGTLSVVICNYNHAQYLPQSLQAILDQSYRPQEVIVIDDGSTDNSVDVVEEFARKDPIIHLYRNEGNRGVLFSANRGLRIAAGDYIYWGAADDWICPGLFEKSMNLLAQYPQAGLCSALAKLVGEDGKDKGRIKMPVISTSPCFLSPETVLAMLIKYDYWIAGNTAICRREVVMRETDGFMPELRHYADQFVYRVVGLKCGTCFIPEVLATWRLMDSGYSMNMANDIELSRMAFEKMGELMRSPKHASLFTETYTKIWERRARCGMEMHHARQLLRTHLNFLGRLRALRKKPTFFDRGCLSLLKLVVMTQAFVAKIYIWHRWVHWDVFWLARMLIARSFKTPARDRFQGSK